jgi:hypothetical protein
MKVPGSGAGSGVGSGVGSGSALKCHGSATLLSAFFYNVRVYGPLSSCRSCATLFPGFILQLGIFRRKQIREHIVFRPRWWSGILLACHAGTLCSNRGGLMDPDLVLDHFQYDK